MTLQITRHCKCVVSQKELPHLLGDVGLHSPELHIHMKSIHICHIPMATPVSEPVCLTEGPVPSRALPTPLLFGTGPSCKDTDAHWRWPSKAECSWCIAKRSSHDWAWVSPPENCSLQWRPRWRSPLLTKAQASWGWERQWNHDLNQGCPK